jgi:hypothetical protein
MKRNGNGKGKTVHTVATLIANVEYEAHDAGSDWWDRDPDCVHGSGMYIFVSDHIRYLYDAGRRVKVLFSMPRPYIFPKAKGDAIELERTRIISRRTLCYTC